MAIMVSPYMPIIYPDPERRSIEEWLFTNACKTSDAIVAQTSRCAEDLVSSYGISAEHIRVIPSPVNCAEVREKASESCPQEIIDMKGKTIFVHVERFAHQKGHRLLLEATELLRKRYDNFVVLCIGDGELFEEIKNEIHVRGLEKHVLQLGRKLNPYPYIKASRALLLTSDLEGMPIILLDALSIGTPIISTDCPTGPREILEDGKYGILLPVGDAQAIADAMWQMINDDNLVCRLTDLGPQRAARYDLPNIIHEWEQLFKEIQIDQEKRTSA
jgi:glycosyltransferase involved in cell wall biosynthesis